MSCKEVIGDLYNIFPSDSRRKCWQEQDLDIAEKTVQHVRRNVDGLLNCDHFLNAVDTTEAVRSLSFFSTRYADCSNSWASASILTLILLSRSWYYSFFLGKRTPTSTASIGSVASYKPEAFDPIQMHSIAAICTLVHLV